MIMCLYNNIRWPNESSATVGILSHDNPWDMCCVTSLPQVAHHLQTSSAVEEGLLLRDSLESTGKHHFEILSCVPWLCILTIRYCCTCHSSVQALRSSPCMASRSLCSILTIHGNQIVKALHYILRMCRSDALNDRVWRRSIHVYQSD